MTIKSETQTLGEYVPLVGGKSMRTEINAQDLALFSKKHNR